MCVSCLRLEQESEGSMCICNYCFLVMGLSHFSCSKINTNVIYLFIYCISSVEPCVCMRNTGMHVLVRLPVHQTYLRQNLGVADNDDTILGSGQGDVKTSRIIQKSDTLMFISSHT